MQHILKNKENLKVCCAVNDFASVNVDQQTLAREDADNNSKDSVIAVNIIILLLLCLEN
jgi:G3E family GTPase